MAYAVVRPLSVPPRRRRRRPIPAWLRRIGFALSLVLATMAGVAFSNWIGSVSDTPGTGPETVTTLDPQVSPMTSRAAPTTADPP